MLTDYHLHLRPDEDGHPARALLHRRERRALPGRRRGGRDRGARRLRARLPLPPGARPLAPPALGRKRPRRPRRLLRVRPRDAAAAGDRVRLRPRRRGPDRDAARGRATSTTSSARSTSSARATPPSTTRAATSGRARRPRRGLAPLLRDARRVRPLAASSTSSPTPTWSRSGAGRGRCPSATRAPTTSPRSRRSPRAGSRSRSRPPGCASRSASSTRRAASPRCASRPGRRFALSSDAHLPEQVGFGYDRAVEFLDELGVGEICVFEGRRRQPGAARRRGRADDGRDRLRQPPLRRGPPAGPRRGRDRARPRASPGHSDADVLTHAVIDALLGAAGGGDIGTLFPDDDERWRDADSIDLLRTVVGTIAGPDRQHRRDRGLRAAAPRPLPGARWSGHSPRRPRPGSASRRPSNEGMGWIGRGEGIACIAVACVE